MLTPNSPRPGLTLVVDGRPVHVPPGRLFVVGRGPEADLDLAHPKSRGAISCSSPTGTGWVITDRTSNGPFVGSRRIDRLEVRFAVALRLGGSDDGPVPQVLPSVTGPIASPEAASRIHPMPGRLRVSVGRLPDNDVVMDDLLVSRRHAVLERRGADCLLRGSGSGNGTFVNGRRAESAVVTAADLIGVGRSVPWLAGDTLVETLDRGGHRFTADGLTVKPARDGPCCTV